MNLQYNSSKKITKNIFSLSFGQGLNLLFNFLSIILAARYLGVENFGEFSYLVAVVGILAKVIDFGISPIVFRESSKGFNHFELLNTGLSIRILLFVIVLIIFNVSAILLSFNSNEIILANILLAGIIISTKFQNFRDLFEIPFKVELKMHYPMIFTLLDNIILIVLVLIMPYVKGGIFYFVSCYTIANLPGFLFLLFVLYKKFDYSFTIELNKIKWLIKEAAPLLGYVIMLAIFQQIDFLLLKNMDSKYATGIYGVANRLAMPFNIIPYAISTTFFPIIVKNINNDEGKNNELKAIILKILLFISYFLAVMISFKSTKIISILFGIKYLSSSLPMILLLGTQIFLFYNFFTVDIFIAYNKQRYILIYYALILILDTTLSLFLIPKYSFNGVAIAKIISAIFGSGYLYFVASKLNLKMKFMNSNIILWCIFLILLFKLLSYLPIIWYGTFALFIIIPITVLLKFFNKKEIILILKIFNKQDWGEKFLKI